MILVLAAPAPCTTTLDSMLRYRRSDIVGPGRQINDAAMGAGEFDRGVDRRRVICLAVALGVDREAWISFHVEDVMVGLVGPLDARLVGRAVGVDEIIGPGLADPK